MIDAPGHGDSHHDDADLDEAARLSVEVGGDAVYLGYSMGGRVALHAALAAPDRVRALVLIGATAGIDDAAERAARRAADEALAAELERQGLPAFLDDWLAQPLFATLPPEVQHRAARLRNRPEGLAASLRTCGTGSQRPLWADVTGLTTPTLLMAGGEDPKFTALAERMTVSIGPSASAAIIPGAGHSVHLERPNETADAVLAFTAGLDG